MFVQLYDAEIGLGKLFKRRDLFHLLLPQTPQTTRDLASSEALRMFQHQFEQTLHTDILAKTIP